MYSDAFCKIYNEFGWNYAPEVFGEKLLAWMEKNQVQVKTSMDLACGTGVLCECLYKHGIKAAGMDFSEGMIVIARENNPEIAYEVADMITYCPGQQFDLVTCTGDALNHIMDLKDVEQIFKNVYAYVSEGGYFIFDLLNENEVSQAEAFELDFDDHVRAQFMVTQESAGVFHLKTTVYEDGVLQVEEVITEKVHDPEIICGLLQNAGFKVLKCADRLLDEGENHSTSWYVIAQKQEVEAVKNGLRFGVIIHP